MVHAVLEDPHLVGLGGQGIGAHPDLTLPGSADLVVVHLHHQAHGFHGAAHGGPQIVQTVYRRHGEITAAHPGAMPHVAVLHAQPRCPGRLLGAHAVARPAHVGMPTDVVEDEEL